MKFLYKIKKRFQLYGDFIIVKMLFLKFKNVFFKPKLKQGLTIVITSSGRLIYLKKTLESLRKNLAVDFPVFWYIIDDFPDSQETKDFIKSQDFDIKIFNRKNKGLGYSLNRIYSQVKTNYILHCEDDWEFLKQVPISRMKKIMEDDKSIGQVILNRVQPYKKAADSMFEDYGVYDKTFSFNPHLTTKKIISKCIPYPLKETERKITDRMRNLKIKSVILGYKKDNYVNHIGEEKHAIKY